jgi:hypothetical protein
LREDCNHHKGVATRSLAVLAFEDGFAKKQGKCGLKVLERYLETAELGIAAYMQGRKLAAVSRRACSKSALAAVFHQNQVREVVLVEVLASCSFAAAAVVVVVAAAIAAAVAGVQEWVDFAVDHQKSQT